MKINTKVILIISAVFVLFLIFSAALCFFVIVGAFDELETEQTKKKLNNIREAVAQEILDLGAVNMDWARWDDTYHFIKGQKDDYIEINLDKVTLKNLRVNNMLFYNDRNELVWLASSDELGNTKDIIEHFEQSDLYIDSEDEKKAISNIVNVEDSAYIFSSMAVTKNVEDSDIAGRLIMIREVDKREIDYLENLTGQTFNVHFSFSTVPYIDEQKKEILYRDMELLLHRNLKSSSAYLLFDAVNQEFGMMLESQFTRSILQQGIWSVVFFIVLLSLAAVLLVVTLVFFLKKHVLERISITSRELDEIERKNIFNKRISENRDDEITNLQININKTLSVLEQALNKSKRSEKSLKQKSDELEVLTKELESTMEDFYTIRIGMQEDIEKGQLEKENKKIKKRITELKKRKP